MCLALALLGSASHAIPFWLDEFRTNKTRLRLGLCTAQSLVLLIGFLYRKNSLKKRADDESDDNVSRYEVALVLFMLMTVFWDLALFFGLFFMKEKPGYGIRITNVLIALSLTCYYISTVINLKFKLRDCNMNTDDDNK